MLRFYNKFQPHTINEIYENLINSSCGPIKYFRIRDIFEIKDFLIYEQSLDKADAFCYEENSYLTLDCYRVKYILLSSTTELRYFKRHKKGVVISEVYQAYMKSKYGLVGELPEFSIR